jgi:hypothetical protein
LKQVEGVGGADIGKPRVGDSLFEVIDTIAMPALEAEPSIPLDVTRREQGVMVSRAGILDNLEHGLALVVDQYIAFARRDASSSCS